MADVGEEERERAAPEPPAGEPGWLRRHRLALGMLAAGAVLVVVVVAGLAVWSNSSLVVVPQRTAWPEDVRVEAVRGDAIVLSRDEDTERPGVYGLFWQGGRAVVGPVLARGEETVTRQLREVHGYLVADQQVGIDNNVWAGDPAQALDIPFRPVRYASELGPMPAWFVPGRSRTWAIFVHGINGDPQGGLRLLPMLRRAGLSTLAIAYREDPGAPSADGKHHMGLTEWRDLQSAARYALDHGARRLVLVGQSMGGSLIAQFMQRSPLADRVSGLVLDAPALDWEEILAFGATELGLPALASEPVEWAVGARIDADWDSLDAARHPQHFQLPILIFHGEDDDLVPLSVSKDFAAALPDRVELHRVPGAGHVDAWNVDPGLYERRTRRFLDRVGASEASGEPVPAG